MTEPDGYISRDRARQLAGGISRATAWRWTKAGRFPSPVKLGPAKLAYRESEIREWLADPSAWAVAHGGFND